jgi:hypothetical protein
MVVVEKKTICKPQGFGGLRRRSHRVLGDLRNFALQNSVHKSCRLGFRGTGVSYQFNIQHYECRNVPLVHFCTSILVNPGYQEYFHRHVTPIPQKTNSLERRATC